MRKELYKMICEKLSRLYRMADGSVCVWTAELESQGVEEPDGMRVFPYIDLWNHNVEFIEQEENWERPAVFVEFSPIRWSAIVDGVEYRAEPEVKLHIVTDWRGSASANSEFREEALNVFELPLLIHETLALMEGETFKVFDLVGSETNHNHEEIVESVEIYTCVAFRSLRNE